MMGFVSSVLSFFYCTYTSNLRTALSGITVTLLDFLGQATAYSDSTVNYISVALSNGQSILSGNTTLNIGNQSSIVFGDLVMSSPQVGSYVLVFSATNGGVQFNASLLLTIESGMLLFFDDEGLNGI
jgi:hypothetical protein